MDAFFGAAFDHAAVFIDEIADDVAADGVVSIMQDGVAFQNEDVLLREEGSLLGLSPLKRL